MSPLVIQLQKSISALTTAIHLVQPQSAAGEIPIHPTTSNSRTLSKAYNRLAILLTQGTDADGGAGTVAVTGGSNGPGPSISVLEEIDDPNQLLDSGSSDGIHYMVQGIQPSKKTLDELADPSGLSTHQVPLAEHTSDVFKALIDLFEDKVNGLMSFLQFVWLQCYRRIKHRLAADEVMLGKPLYALLEQWKLADRDVVETRWFDVNPHLGSSFDSVNIPSRPLDERRRQYQFSHSTVPAWCTLFIRALKEVKVRATRCDMRTASITELNKMFLTLNILLYKNDTFQTLLALPSLFRDIGCAVLVAQQERRLQQLAKSFDAHPLEDGLCPDGPTSPILNWCKGVVAWLQAGISLSHSKLLYKSSMVSLRDLMMDIILPKSSANLDVA